MKVKNRKEKCKTNSRTIISRIKKITIFTINHKIYFKMFIFMRKYCKTLPDLLIYSVLLIFPWQLEEGH